MDIFSYELPQDKIAQRPWDPADEAKMLVIDRISENIDELKFVDLPSLLNIGDLVVLNDTRVVPARLFGKLLNKDVEILLIRELSEDRWEVLGKPMKLLANVSNDQIVFNKDLQGRIECVRDSSDNIKMVCNFLKNDKKADRNSIMTAGSMPIPPYIRKGRGDERDLVDYQTIFGRNEGSIAAPTASLHITERVLSLFQQRGIEVIFLTLHVGVASFLPIWKGSKRILERPASESFKISKDSYIKIANAKSNCKRIVAVGTTVARALETVDVSDMEIDPSSLVGDTDIFITPTYKWRTATNLVTNFHQPGTSHLLLVESLLGRNLLDRAYKHALKSEYRFLSYGDGMIIL